MNCDFPTPQELRVASLLDRCLAALRGEPGYAEPIEQQGFIHTPLMDPSTVCIMVADYSQEQLEAVINKLTAAGWTALVQVIEIWCPSGGKSLGPGTPVLRKRKRVLVIQNRRG